MTEERATDEIGQAFAEFQLLRENYLSNHAAVMINLSRGLMNLLELEKANIACYEHYCKTVADWAVGKLELFRAQPEFKKKLLLRLKEDYWTQLVQISRRDIEELRKRVNALLRSDNGTPFLNMSYEEVLFPAVMLGKKKYFGIPHLKTENFHPEMGKYFIKGVDIIKRGQALIAQELGYEIVRDACSLESEASMEEIVMLKLHKFFNNDWDTRYFQFSGKYKLPKMKDGKQMPGNISILQFIKRMKGLHEKYKQQKDFDTALDYEPPEVNDEFKYVIVRKDISFDERGYKTTPQKGDKMEFTRVFQKYRDRMEIDQNHYFEKSILTLFARFLSYKPEFEPGPEIIRETKQYDQAIIDAASTFIENKCNEFGWLKNMNDKHKNKGTLFRRINSALINTLETTFKKIGGNAAVSYIGAVDIAQKNVTIKANQKLIKKGLDIDEDWNWVKSKRNKELLAEIIEVYRIRAQNLAIQMINADYGRNYLSNLPIDMLREQRKEWTEYKMKNKRAHFEAQIAGATKDLEMAVINLNEAYSQYAGESEFIIAEARNGITDTTEKKEEISKYIAQKLTSGDNFGQRSEIVKTATQEFDKAYETYAQHFMQYRQIESIYAAFSEARAKETGIPFVQTISKKDFLKSVGG